MNENDIRTLYYCPKFYQFNGSKSQSKESAILNKTYARITTLLLKNNKINTADIFNSLVSVFSNFNLNDLLPVDKTNLLNKLNIAIHDAVSFFDFENYIPIFGPFRINTKLKNHTFTFTINGVFRNSKTKTLHIVEFSDYPQHAIRNDYTLHAKIDEIKQLVPSHHSGRARTYLHVFYFKNNILNQEIISSEEIRSKPPLALSDIMTNETYFPILPCNRKCEYKKQCL